MAVEKVLSYSRSRVGDYDGVGQTRSWDCGPASAQIVLQAAGVNKTEQWLIDRIGTTTAGTNHTGLITPVLNELLPGSGYRVVWLTSDPPTAGQVDTLWNNVKRSIDGNRGCIANFVAPPWNFPRPSYTSKERLNYTGNSTIYHYVALMGYAVDDAGGRHLWIADPGFRPYGMWCRAEDVARLITPHSYCYAADVVAAPPPSSPTVDRLAQLWLEWTATQYGDRDSISQLVKAAKAGDPQSVRALTLLERVNPDALRSYITVTKG